MLRITAILTVHNRAAKTEACIRGLFAQEGLGHKFDLRAVVVDDGSSDGTAGVLARLSLLYPIEVVTGSGSLYWAAGMALAEATATLESPDLLLWLNDDVQLLPDAVARALQELPASGPPIVVGATIDQTRTSITYTGSRLASRRPGSLQPVAPTSVPEKVDAFNGNFVLVPRHAYQAMGGVDGSFEHGYGDIDYGLRARRAGIPIVLMPGIVGICDRNSKQGTWQDPALSRRSRLRGLVGRKGYPPVSHWRFNVRHGGVLGSVYAASTYVKSVLLILLGRPS